jgi:hypothetical protein
VVGVGRGEMRESMGRQGHGETASVMLWWDCWEADIGLCPLWCQDCDSGRYVGGVIAIDEWEVDVFWKDGWPVLQSHYIRLGEGEKDPTLRMGR